MADTQPNGMTPTGHQRWLICALLFIATAINYMDRQVLGLLAPILEKRFAWTESTYADLVSVFQIAYVVGLVLAGPLLVRLGTRVGYAAGVGAWSLAIAAHALATTTLGFGAARAVLGLGEAANFPAAVKAVASWFPRRERALANGIFNAGANAGAMVAPVLVPWLAVVGGWQLPFIVLGAAGGLWLVAWWLFYDEPEQSTRISATERAWITQDARPAHGPVTVPDIGSWWSLLRLPQTWALMIGFACSAPVWWFWLFWLPKLLATHFALSPLDSSQPIALVYAMTCVGSIGGGWLSSHLIGRGWIVARARFAAMLLCALLVVPVVLVPSVTDPWLACILIGMAAAAHQGWAANLFALASDRFPRQAVAVITSLGLVAGTAASVVAATCTGAILDAGIGYTPLLWAAAFAYVAGIIPMQILLRRWPD